MGIASELKKNALATVKDQNALLELSGAEPPRNGDYPRKPRLARYLDLMYMSLRWGEISSSYYAQEIDRKERSIVRDFLPHRRFKSIRDRHNRRPGSHPFDYCCFLQDKLLLENHLRPSGLRTARTLAVIHPDLTLEMLEPRARRPLGECLEDPSFSLHGFCKPRFGVKGNGVFFLDAADGELTIDDEPATLDDLKSRINAPYLVQIPVRQHPELARLHPRSVNTIRIITVMDTAGDVEIFMALLRIGGGGSLTDNSLGGKLVVNIDHESHHLEKSGYWTAGFKYRPVTRHPDTGVDLAQVKVPWFEQCCTAAREAHRTLPEIRSVGWDLAVEADGVCLLEGNDDWGGNSAMWLMRDFPRQFASRFGS